MASISFFKVDSSINKPTQAQIELVRRRALSKIKHGRGNATLDAKSVESLLRMVAGRYSDLQSSLEKEYRKSEHRLDSKFAQGVKLAKAHLIKIQHDVRRLELLGYERDTSGIDYSEMVARLKSLSKDKRTLGVNTILTSKPAQTPTESSTRENSKKQTVVRRRI